MATAAVAMSYHGDCFSLRLPAWQGSTLKVQFPTPCVMSTLPGWMLKL